MELVLRFHGGHLDVVFLRFVETLELQQIVFHALSLVFPVL